MKFFFERAVEASSFAGIGLILMGVSKILANGISDGEAWASIATGVAAVLKKEGK